MSINNGSCVGIVFLALLIILPIECSVLKEDIDLFGSSKKKTFEDSIFESRILKQNLNILSKIKLEDFESHEEYQIVRDWELVNLLPNDERFKKSLIANLSKIKLEDFETFDEYQKARDLIFDNLIPLNERLDKNLLTNLSKIKLEDFEEFDKYQIARDSLYIVLIK